MNTHIKNVLPFLIGALLLGINSATQVAATNRESPFFWAFAACFVFGIWNTWSNKTDSIKDELQKRKNNGRATPNQTARHFNRFCD